MIKEIEIFRENYLKDYSKYQVNDKPRYLKVIKNNFIF